MEPTREEVKAGETVTEMTWIVMPGQTNALGTVFGGQVMSWVDVCAAVSAQRFARSHVVTASMDRLDFRNSIRSGDVVVLRSMVNWAGRTSMEVGVRVEREDPHSGSRTHTATAYLTFVALDRYGQKRSVPRLLPENEEQEDRARAAEHRRALRLAARDVPPKEDP